MPTKFSRFCDGVMEAGWIAAIVLAPLFFNVYSSRIFEPDKLTLLRSLALVVLGAWLLKVLFEGGVRWETFAKGDSALKTLLRTPLVLPVVGLVIVYTLSTIFSIHPLVSLMGSYQRLQGTYTTFSYLVIFAAMAVNMRRRVQVERFVSALILTSLPISLYGILQRYQIDPVPWAGDVTTRVASNMGNAIFVAAYLIMVSPFTLVRIVESFAAILKEQEGVFVHVARATVYVFIAALQLIALYLSQSRGPWLGWMAGAFFLFVLLTLTWRKRSIMLGVIGVGLALGIFLVLLNIPNGPLQPLRSVKFLERFSHLAEAESDTGRVRVLIWEGVAKLVAPHEPLEFPDGRKDTFNFLRPLIGYGPETIYVAFNRFYPPELGTLEKRNASPDRSHNETWDSLAITGFLGLFVYLFLFGSVFYYGLKWLGLIASPRQRNLFLLFYIGSGVLGAGAMIAWRGIAYLGVGLPFGIIVGMLTYLALGALLGFQNVAEERSFNPMALYIIAPLAAIAGHFVETNFGISIAATRTLFWTSAALMFVSGYVMPRILQAELPAVEHGSLLADNTARKSTRRERARRAASQPLIAGRPAWVHAGLIAMLILSVLLLTLGYEFISSGKREADVDATVGAVLVNSFTRLANRDNAPSPGVLALMTTTWLAGGIILLAGEQISQQGKEWLKALGLALGGALLVSFFLWLLHANNLVNIANTSPASLDALIAHLHRTAGLVVWYYVVLLLLLSFLALFLPESWPTAGNMEQDIWQPLVAVVVLVVVLVTVATTNLNNVRANMIFKMGEPLSGDQYQVASYIFKEAVDTQPKEDFYYLYLGRSYLEQAKTQEDAAAQDRWVQQAEQTLQTALQINPLNTDHSANLARMYSWWYSRSTDDEVRLARGEKAVYYYTQALSLSPNSAPLWTEKANALLNIGRNDEALDALLKAAALDSTYIQAHGLLGELYMRQAQNLSDPSLITQTYELAAEYFGLGGAGKGDGNARISYYAQQGNIYLKLGSPERARDAFLAALELKPGSSVAWQLEETLARVSVELGDKAAALLYAQSALEHAPQEQSGGIQQLIEQIQSMP
ncbi:MAG: tetratricopeptide repeat protein [Chloroflexota bacterium]